MSEADLTRIWHILIGAHNSLENTRVLSLVFNLPLAANLLRPNSAHSTASKVYVSSFRRSQKLLLGELLVFDAILFSGVNTVEFS